MVSVAEFASRSLGPNSLSARLRPKEYKNVPEATLNATLKDIHDLIQYAVIQAQRIVFGQDLDKTFAVSRILIDRRFGLTNRQTFLSCTALYWLTKIVPPLWLAVMGLTSLYIAPLVASPRGRAVAHNAGVRAQELTNAAAGNSKRLAQDGKANVVDLSSKARQTTLDAEGCIRNVAESGKQTVADMSARAKGTASDISGVAGENVRKVPQTGTSAINKAAGTVSSTLGDAKQRISSSLSTNIDGNSDGNRSGSGGAGNEASQLFSNVAGTATAPGDVLDRASSAANKAWQLSSTASETAKQVAPRGHAAKQPTSDHLESVVSSLPGQSGAEKAGSVADTVSKYAVAGDMAATHGIQDRPRGAALPAGV